jgi:hypothetical protein
LKDLSGRVWRQPVQQRDFQLEDQPFFRRGIAHLFDLLRLHGQVVNHVNRRHDVDPFGEDGARDLSEPRHDADVTRLHARRGTGAGHHEDEQDDAEQHR